MTSALRPGHPTWVRRAAAAVMVVTVAVALFALSRPRSPSLPLVTLVDGPSPAHADGVIVYLHGLGDSVSGARGIVGRLRGAGVPASVAIVLMQGPHAYGLGHSWGHSEEEQATSRARVRARLHELLGSAGPPPDRVIIAGFSQGAGMALDTAVSEARIGAVASFAPCLSWLRGELPKRGGLRILLVHGTRDTRCPVEESRSLKRALEAAHKDAHYIEFDGEHTVPPEALRALAELARSF